ncbi:MAG: cytochrome P450, partial [Chloroflexota bacterium]
LEVIHDALGDVFALPLPGFNAVMLVGPEANRFLLVEEKQNLLWRAETDPVTHLLRHGVLVEDGDSHDALRRQMNPPLHRTMLEGYVDSMTRCTDQVMAGWGNSSPIDLLPEMRRVALLILTETLFKEDFSPQLQSLWQAVLSTLHYISPGLWLLWRGVPRPGHARGLRQMDDYLYRIIAERRAHLGTPDDLLGSLIASGMSDALIRDQLLTMLIAGHDTSTALLAWALYLLTTHSDVLAQAREEVDRVLGNRAPNFQDASQLPYLDQVVRETLRLYPPIHLGSRIAATNISYQGYDIPAGTRVLYSIYLTHRDKKYWSEPGKFNPDRFAPEKARQQIPYTFLPFGGGARNCIGTAFAQVEAKIVLARILQTFDLRSTGKTVRPKMGATLEPQPGVLVEVSRR